MDNKVVNIPISLIRDLLDNKVYSKSDALIDILSMADRNGEVHTSVRKLMSRWNWGNTKVVNFIKFLEQKDICKTEARREQDAKQYTTLLMNTGLVNSYKDSRQDTGKTQTRQEQSIKTIKTTDALRMILDAWNSLSSYGIEPIPKFGISSSQYSSLTNLAKAYSVNDILQSIEKIKTSDFLQGKVGYGWKIYFNWFLKEDNYKKLRSGMYNDNRRVIEPTEKEVSAEGPEDEELIGDEWVDL